MFISVIITTYNHPTWLRKVLHGYLFQSHVDFELVIADDGSGEETKAVIEEFKEGNPEQEVQHIWHEDKGFRKTVILNKALLATKYDYVLFTDGDCIPRTDFLATHIENAEEGFFLSGGYCKLPMDLSNNLTLDDISSGRAFDASWAKRNGLRKKRLLTRLSLTPRLGKIADSITPTKATWNGQNSSTFKKNLLAVNGFNEIMEYGGLDRELGERLANLGLKSKQIRERAITLHLDHSRGYKTKETLQKNMALRKNAIDQKLTWIPDGFNKETPTSRESLGTYLINLDKSEDRLTLSSQQLDQYNIPFERFAAIDGETLDIADYPEATGNKRYYHRQLNIKEVACYLSHLEVLKKFLESSYSHALVLEDDFVWNGDPIPILDELVSHCDYDIVKLFRMKKRKAFKLHKKLQTNSGGTSYEMRKYPSPAICNLGQVYTRIGAEKIINRFSEIRRPFDVDLKHYWEYDLNIFSLSPNVIEQSEISNETTIGKRGRKKTLVGAINKQAYHFEFALHKWWNYFFN